MMTDVESTHAWKIFNRNWIVLSLLALTLGLGLAVTEFELLIGSKTWVRIGLSAVLAIIAYTTIGLFKSRLSFICGSLIQLEILSLLVPPLTYLAASANLPLQDDNLARFDAMLGLDWQAYYRFFVGRPELIPYVDLGYAMIVWPIFGIPLALGIACQHLRLQQFTLACALTLIVTTLAFILVPALGTYYHYGIEAHTPVFKAGGSLGQLRDLPLIRDGSLRILNISELHGIIAFPSFHSAAAVLSIWALWCIWWLRPLALISNVGMLLATPIMGGHYFVDVFAGGAVAVFTIIVVHRVTRARPEVGRSTAAAHPRQPPTLQLPNSKSAYANTPVSDHTSEPLPTA